MMENHDCASLNNVRTERLLLRKLTYKDLDAAAEIHGDPATNIYSPSGARSREVTETLIMDWISFWDKHGYGYWTVCCAANNDDVLGFGGVMRKQIGDFSGLNIYFRFATRAWGAGYASEMASTAVHAAFKVLDETAVYGLVRPDNLPSRRTLEKIGMRIWSEVDDVPGQKASLIYRLTREEYAARAVRHS